MSSIPVISTYDNLFQEYPDKSDYSQVFMHQMTSLHLLSVLVTADKELADECFSKALDEYVEGDGGFMEWAKSEGRRAVLQHAFEMIRPVPRKAYSWSFYENTPSAFLAVPLPFAVITSLSPFERFVFVMSSIEGFSEQECASLLQCSVWDVTIGRELARRIISEEDESVV
jgi:hypothetical protein